MCLCSLHGLLSLFLGLSNLLLPQLLGHLRLLLHLREALTAHLLSTQTFLCTELHQREMRHTDWLESKLDASLALHSYNFPD